MIPKNRPFAKTSRRSGICAIYCVEFDVLTQHVGFAMPGGVGGGNVSIPQGFMPPGQDQAAQQFQGLVGNIYGPWTAGAYNPSNSAFGPYTGASFGPNVPQTGYAPYFNEILAGGFSNPFLNMAMSGSQNASQAATGVGNQAIDLSQMLSGLPGQIAGSIPQLQGMAGQIWNQAADPQQALYNMLSGQQGAQLNAQNAMSGLSGTPYGANLVSQGLQNFSLNWQNELLNRMMQGGQAAGNLYGRAGSLGAMAPQIGQSNLALGQGGANLINQAGQWPMNVWDQYINQLMGLTGAAQTGIMQPLQAGAGDLMNYLKLGQDSQQNALNRAQLQLQQQQQQQSGFGSMLGGLVMPALFGQGGIGSIFGGQGLLGGVLDALPFIP
jgi:hypothetical protein